MGRRTEPLEPYIQKAHYGSLRFFCPRIFGNEASHNPPILKSNRTNRILLYPGCFNPPHVGHMKVLTHIFENTRDINAIAVIILPLDDDKVQSKVRREQGKLAFTKSERVRLWNPLVASDRFWVYGRSLDDWRYFRQRLEKYVARDGFRLEWCLIGGADKISVHKAPPWNAWGCREFIVSDAGRASRSLWRAGYLVRLVDCEDWERVEVKSGMPGVGAASWVGGCDSTVVWEAPRGLKEKLEKLDKDLDLAIRMTADHRTRIGDRVCAVSLCRRTGRNRDTIRFISAEIPGSPDVSSTEIRRLLKTCRPKDLREVLKGLVPHPDVLLEIYGMKELRGG